MSHTYDYSVVRFSLAGPVSLIITFLLFVLMQDLIKNNGDSVTSASGPLITIRSAILEPRKPIDPRIRPPQPDIVDPPVTPPQITDDESLAGVIPVLFTRLEPVTNGRGSDLDIQSPGEGDILPIVKVRPIYPRAALINGIEGFVIVEFTVTTIGTTRDIRVLDASPSSIFNQASISAASRFKYKPRIIDGVAVEVQGVRNKFSFILQQE